MTNGEAVQIVREWLVEHVFRNGFIMHDQAIREASDIDPREYIDLIDVISGLYEILHAVVYDEPYDYMWHWANKCGSWCESDFFVNMIKEARRGENDETQR